MLAFVVINACLISYPVLKKSLSTRDCWYTCFISFLLIDPGDNCYWFTQEASTDVVVQLPGVRVCRGQRCVATPPVSRAAEFHDGKPSVITRLMDIGLFYHYVMFLQDILIA